eukprot:gene9194-11268_t
MESYSPSIQKLFVYLKAQSEISNNGISYSNTILTDLSNSILIESINNANTIHKQQKTIFMDDVEKAINAIFPSEIADHIIDQSQGRIQHTSMRNLPQYKNTSDQQQQQLQQQSSSVHTSEYESSSVSSSVHEDDDDDDEVNEFEIIPHENVSYHQNLSLYFPIELVYQVTNDLIQRQKIIHRDTDFYHLLELQPKDSFIYTFISYAMETITTRIIKRIPDIVEINEDVIRKAIQDDQSLKEIRHKSVQINNITNRILQGDQSFANLSTSLSTSSLLSSILDSKLNNDINNNNNNLNNNNNNNNLIEQQPTENINSSIIKTSTNDQNTTNISSSPSSNVINSNNNNNSTTSVIVNDQHQIPSPSSTSTTTTTTTTKTKTTPTSTIRNRNLKKKSSQDIVNEVKKTITIPSLFTIKEQVDLVQLFSNGFIHLEAT